MFRKPRSDNGKERQINKLHWTLRKINEATIKQKAQMPNMEELISRMSRKISEEKEGEIHITKLDFDYAYGQLRLDEQTRNLCIFTVTGGEFTGYYRFLTGVFGLADIPTIFQERIAKHSNNNCHQRKRRKTGSVDRRNDEKLEEAGYRLNP